MYQSIKCYKTNTPLLKNSLAGKQYSFPTPLFFFFCFFCFVLFCLFLFVFWILWFSYSHRCTKVIWFSDGGQIVIKRIVNVPPTAKVHLRTNKRHQSTTHTENFSQVSNYIRVKRTNKLKSSTIHRSIYLHFHLLTSDHKHFRQALRSVQEYMRLKTRKSEQSWSNHK